MRYERRVKNRRELCLYTFNSYSTFVMSESKISLQALSKWPLKITEKLIEQVLGQI